MANSSSQSKSYFNQKIAPIMDEVMKDLREKQREEYLKNANSSSAFLSMAAGPDGGMSAQAAQNMRVFHTGEWNTKHTEEYISMVTAELKKQNIKVTPEIENMMIDKMVEEKIPKSSIDYFAKYTPDHSIFVSVLSSLSNIKSPLDKKIEEEAEKRYNPTFREKAAAMGAGFAFDSVITSGVAVAGGIAKGTITTARGLWKATRNALGWSTLAIGVAACTPAPEGITKKAPIAVPMWMKDKFGIDIYCGSDPERMKQALSWAEKNAEAYEKLATNAIKTGRSVKVGNQIMTPTQLKERQLQYSLFARELKNSLSVPAWMLKQNGIKSFSSATDAELEKAKKWAAKNGDAYLNMMRKINPEKTPYYKDGKGNVHPISEADTRLCQYMTMIREIEKEQVKRAEKLAQTPQEAYAVMADSQHVDFSTASVNTEGQQNTEGQGNTQTAGNAAGKDFSGWGQMMKKSGLSALMKNPGLAIAMLPDMLVGMFTGKETSFGLNASTMLPLAAIFGSFFTKNPLLKMLMLAGGGLGFFAKTAKEISPDKEENTEYKKYPEEVLNTRISRVKVEGNTILLDIDGVPRSVVVPATVAEAYKSGALPESTLANAVLKKYDEQQAELTANYEAQQSRGAGVGIK